MQSANLQQFILGSIWELLMEGVFKDFGDETHPIAKGDIIGQCEARAF